MLYVEILSVWYSADAICGNIICLVFCWCYMCKYYLSGILLVLYMEILSVWYSAGAICGNIICLVFCWCYAWKYYLSGILLVLYMEILSATLRAYLFSYTQKNLILNFDKLNQIWIEKLRFSDSFCIKQSSVRGQVKRNTT